MTTVVVCLVGFALWVIYVDGVLPLGFPTEPNRQRTWLVAQFALALAVTVAAAAVTAVPVAASGAVSIAGALLEGGAFVVGLLALAVLAGTAEHPVRRLALTRTVAAAAVAALTSVAVLVPIPATTFSGLVAVVIVAASAADVAGRSRRPSPERLSGTAAAS